MLIIILCPLLNGCVTISVLDNAFPDNKTIQNISDAAVEFYFDLFPPRNQNYVIEYMNMCFSNDSMNINGRIRTDGFYYYPKKHESIVADTIYKYDSEDPWGREIYRNVFYPDGMFGGSLWFKDGRCGNGEWGMYEIHDDTIIIECITHGSINGPTEGYRDTLVIKSPDTLVLLNRTTIYSDEPNDGYYFWYYRGKRGDELYFMPFDSLPDPNEAWIKKKKWFWCDENNWKENKKTRKKMD